MATPGYQTLLDKDIPTVDLPDGQGTVRVSTEEGGFKLSGLGSLNGHAALDDFIEYKHIALKPGLAGLSGRPPLPMRSASALSA